MTSLPGRHNQWRLCSSSVTNADVPRVCVCVTSLTYNACVCHLETKAGSCNHTYTVEILCQNVARKWYANLKGVLKTSHCTLCISLSRLDGINHLFALSPKLIIKILSIIIFIIVITLIGFFETKIPIRLWPTMQWFDWRSIDTWVFFKWKSFRNKEKALCSAFLPIYRLRIYRLSWRVSWLSRQGNGACAV